MYDVVIIGAGPAGLSAAIEAQKAGLSYVVIEKGGVVNSIQQFPDGDVFFFHSRVARDRRTSFYFVIDAADADRRARILSKSR